MGQLLFRKVFWEPIARGTKRTTLRRWDRPKLKIGQRCYAPGVGWLMIEAVDAIDLDAMTDDDARADGFENVREMMAALSEMYPDIGTDGKHWFRIGFRFTEPTPPRKTKSVKHET